MNFVWEFTNQRRLNKKEFINYFERKVFATIRKHKILARILKNSKSNSYGRKIKIRKSGDLNTQVLKKVLEKKFITCYSSEPNISSDNLSQVAEDIFKNILKGKFSGPILEDKPLYYLSDKEVELYAKLTNIRGTKRKSVAKLQILFEKFLEKNQDLELNIVKALEKIKT